MAPHPSTQGADPGAPDVRPRLFTEAALDLGLAAFAGCDPPGAAAMLAIGGRPALRCGRRGFAGLAATVVGQQVSTASAAAIFGRLASAVQPLTPELFLAADDAALRACGLSRAKVRTLRAVAAAVLGGTLPLDALGALPPNEARRRLVALPGIGPWTADVFLLFCLGEPDAFPAGDLALQEAHRLVFGGGQRPGASALAAAVERWRPWRGVGAYLLWACYRTLRGGGAPLPDGGLTDVRPAGENTGSKGGRRAGAVS